MGTRARDAHLADPGTSESTALWPLLCGTHHTLLLFPEAAAIAVDTLLAGLDGTVKVIDIAPALDPQKAVRERYRVSRPGWVLVRPDHVIAARGGADDLSPLARYVDHVIKPAPAP